LLHIQKARHRGFQAELFRIRRVDAAHERLHKSVQRLTTKSTPHKVRKALINSRGLAAYERFGQQIAAFRPATKQELS
jgi:hypothetical protein